MFSADRTFVIAEAACNHMCDIALAEAMIDCAVEAGADAIKFQTYKADRLVTHSAKSFRGMGTDTQIEYYSRLDKFGREEFGHLFNYARSKGIVPLSTALDGENLDMIHDLGAEVFKISSCEIVSLDLLSRVAKYGKPVVVSTGGATLEEIDEVVKMLSSGGCEIALLACSLSYPTDPSQANLRRIQTLRDRYPYVTIGLSDHTEPDKHMVIPSLAVAMGARVIEKHYTLHRKMKNSGHGFSVNPQNLADMVYNIRLAEKVLGDGSLERSEREEEVVQQARRSAVATVNIEKGQTITEDMITFKRPGTGVSQKKMGTLIGGKATKQVPRDTTINIEDISL